MEKELQSQLTVCIFLNMFFNLLNLSHFFIIIKIQQIFTGYKNARSLQAIAEDYG